MSKVECILVLASKVHTLKKKMSKVHTMLYLEAFSARLGELKPSACMHSIVFSGYETKNVSINLTKLK
jgi:hypothetical protein